MMRRRGARVAEGGCLLSNCIYLVPGVRIPPSPKKTEMNYRFKNISYLPYIGWLFPMAFNYDDAEAMAHSKQGFVLAIFFTALPLTLFIINTMLPIDWRTARFSIVILIYLLHITYFSLCSVASYKISQGQKWEIGFLKQFTDKIFTRP